MAPKKKPSKTAGKVTKRSLSYPSSRTTTPVKKRIKSSSGSSPEKQDAQKTPQRGGEQNRSIILDSTTTPTTPRSAGKYGLRSVTPVDYSFSSKRRSMFTPARTGTNAPPRTPARTPFRTPRIKSVGQEVVPDLRKASKKHKGDAALWKDQLKAILNRQLNICNLSSMRNFNYNSKNLRKQYEGTLKRMVDEVFASPLITVEIRTTSFFSLVPNVVDAVYIQVTSLVPGNTVEEDKMMIVYSSWLFRTSHVQSKKMPGIEWYPLMLYTGRNIIHNAVVDWLQGSFDCYVTKRQLRQSDLLWIAGVWSGRKCLMPGHQGGKGNKIGFSYCIRHPDITGTYPPPNTRSKLKLVMHLNMDDIHHIWDNIIDSSRGEMSVEELQLFMDTIAGCAEQLTSLPVALLQLQQLYTPCLSISSNGKVKLTCIRSASIVVKHLVDIFIQTSNCYALEDHLIQSDEDAESNSVFLTDDEDN